MNDYQKQARMKKPGFLKPVAMMSAILLIVAVFALIQERGESTDRGTDMNATVRQCLQHIELGNPQRYRNMTTFPLFLASKGSVPLLSLDVALQNGHIEVTEVDAGGSVPELKLVNRSEDLVLLLDGEELEGAKQNRVLNASILVAGNSEIVIPVSCSERGRWRYTSKLFSSSGHTMSYSGRSGKASSVAASLGLTGKHRSDQPKVWASIDKLAALAQVKSSTSAMRDVHDSFKKRSAEYLSACPCLPDQKGLLVAIDGEVVGFDLLTSDSAFGDYHEKLLRSYATDALLSRAPDETPVSADSAHAFIQQASLCEEKEYPSVGLGTDYRYNGLTMTGFALVHDDAIVHAAFLRVKDRKRTHQK